MKRDALTQSLVMLLRLLKLPAFVAAYEEFAQHAERDGWTHSEYLRRLVELEISERHQRRIERLRKGSGLPHDKTFGALKTEKLPAKVRRRCRPCARAGSSSVPRTSWPSVYRGGARRISWRP